MSAVNESPHAPSQSVCEVVAGTNQSILSKMVTLHRVDGPRLDFVPVVAHGGSSARDRDQRTSPTQVASLQFRGCKGETSFRVIDLHLKVPFCGDFHEFKEQPLVEVDSTCSPGTAS
uniref:Uncharacterized protein n=1 Tax=Toxoplasma gondii COUG TaxID=1074873 RepID=A0A2G8Y7T0_TOXGO|nr:hypothetical protein TGCOUG_227015 [Toxoplasma gondii COUG]